MCMYNGTFFTMDTTGIKVPCSEVSFAQRVVTFLILWPAMFVDLSLRPESHACNVCVGRWYLLWLMITICCVGFATTLGQMETKLVSSIRSSRESVIKRVWVHIHVHVHVCWSLYPIPWIQTFRIVCYMFGCYQYKQKWMSSSPIS